MGKVSGSQHLRMSPSGSG